MAIGRLAFRFESIGRQPIGWVAINAFTGTTLTLAEVVGVSGIFVICVYMSVAGGPSLLQGGLQVQVRLDVLGGWYLVEVVKLVIKHLHGHLLLIVWVVPISVDLHGILV